MNLEAHPLTPDRWDDLVDLFGPTRGACAGCWCMWPRLRGTEFRALPKEVRREMFEALVRQGPPPGLLLYENALAIGWVAVGPRAAVRRFNETKPSAPRDAISADLDNTWAIPCFYVRNGYRKRGLTQRLARLAIDHAREQGAHHLEICAIEPNRPLTWGEGFVGIASQLTPLGFAEVARNSPTRPLLRIALMDTPIR